MSWLFILAVGYVSFMIYRDYKKKRFENFSAEQLWLDVKSAKFSHYVYGFVIFLVVFLFARGFAIGQSVAQTCEVTVGDNSYFMGNYGFTNEEALQNDDIRKLEQGRSYNFYRRYFNSHGGRPSNVGIVCEWNTDKFIKNVILDYAEVRGVK